MTPKPLSPERLDQTEKVFTGFFTYYFASEEHLQLIKDLLAAEQFWREAVGKVFHRSERCPFCGSACLLATEEPKGHFSDCSWLLAQSYFRI